MKFFLLIIVGLSFQAQADVMLTDTTNPKTSFKSMDECLKSIDTSTSQDASLVNQANDKIYGCLTAGLKEYSVVTEHSVCSNGAKRIKDNKELKNLAVDHCNINFADSMACVKVADKLSDKAKKQKKTRDCVVKNYAYFTPDFCEKMLERADLLGDQELRKTCTERHEKLPSTVTPASSGAAKNRK